jgi:hypothetical protein
MIKFLYSSCIHSCIVTTRYPKASSEISLDWVPLMHLTSIPPVLNGAEYTPGYDQNIKSNNNEMIY